MGFEPCLSALERPTRAVRSETIAVRSFTSSVKSVWASPPIGWRALPGTRTADSEDDFIRVVGPLRSIHAPHLREECGHGRIGTKRQCVRAPTRSFQKLARRIAVAVPGSANLWCPPDGLEPLRGEIGDAVSTARIRRRPPQTRNGAALATPSYSLVPPGGFENSPAGK